MQNSFVDKIVSSTLAKEWMVGRLCISFLLHLVVIQLKSGVEEISQKC